MSSQSISMLVVASRPLNSSLTPPDASAEIREIYRSLINIRERIPSVKLVRAYPPTFVTLQQAAKSGRYSIVHFIGHSDGARLLLETEEGLEHWVKAEDLKELFAADTTDLVVLNVCEGEHHGSEILNAGIQKLIINRREVRDSVAIRASALIYNSLFSGSTVKEAIEDTKHTLKIEGRGEPTLQAIGPSVDEGLADVVSIGEIADIKVKDGIPPNNLDPNIRKTFVGRIQEQIEIYRYLNENDFHIAIEGLPGVGTSGLAQAVAWRYGWFFKDGIAYTSLRKTGRKLNLRDMFLHFHDWNISSIADDVLLNHVSSKLNESQCLLIFDDIDYGDKTHAIDPIIELLSRWDNTLLGGKAILVSSAHQQGFQQLVANNLLILEALDTDSSVELFKVLLEGLNIRALFAVTDDINEQDALQEAAKLCMGHTHLIHAVAGGLKTGTPWRDLRRSLTTFSGSAVDKTSELLQRSLRQMQNNPYAENMLGAWGVFEEEASEEAWLFVAYGSDINTNDLAEISSVLTTMQQAHILSRRDAKARPSSGDYDTTLCSFSEIASKYIKDRYWSPDAVLIPDNRRVSYVEKHADFYLDILENHVDELRSDEIRNMRHAVELAFKDPTRHDKGLKFAEVVAQNLETIQSGRLPWQELHFILDQSIAAIEMRRQVSPEQELPLRLAFGLVLYYLNNYSAAKEQFGKGRELADETSMPLHAVQFDLQLGRIAYRQKEYSEAAKYFNAAIHASMDQQLYDEIIEQVELASNMDHDQIKQLLRGFDPQLERLHDRVATALAFHELGRLQYRIQRYDQARGLLEIARRIRGLEQDKMGLAATLHELARVYHAKGSEDEALTFYDQSIQIKQELGDIRGQIASIHQKGLYFFEHQQYDKAIELYERSLELSEELQDKFWMAHNRSRLGVALYKNNRTDKGLELAREALTIARQYSLKSADGIESWLQDPTDDLSL